MSLRTFENPNTLGGIVVIARLHALDPLAIASSANEPYFEAGQFIDHYVVNVIESSLTDEEINTALSTPETPAETAMLDAFTAAWASYESQPEWFTETAAQLNSRIDAAWFGGKTLTQIQADIDGSATYKVAMKALAAYLFAFRDFYVHRAVVLDVLVRDGYIRPRR